MGDKTEKQMDNIVENISEGIISISSDGVVSYANRAAYMILGVPEGEMTGRNFAAMVMEHPENDEFVQAVLDAIYDKEKTHNTVVPFKGRSRMMHLRMVTSFFQEEGDRKGIIMAIGDLSALVEVQDTLRMMDQVKELNVKLQMRNELLNRTFGRFLSDEIVSHLLDTPEGLTMGGKMQRLTIMMSDLRGFSVLSEQMKPADLVMMLNHYLEAMTEIIQRRRGAIIEFIGDGIMAIFGAPQETDTHEEDAVAAALEMETRMAEVNQWNREHGYPTLEMGIGLHTGDVIIGNIGSEKRTKYGVVGNNVNLCGRIEGYTVGGQVLMSQSTKEGIGTTTEIRNMFPVLPKGAKEEMTLYDVTGIGAPYDVRMPVTETEPEALARPATVIFHRMEGKYQNPEPLEGMITAISEEGAILETETELRILSNIEMDTGGMLYCKVIAKKENGYLVRYTSVPPEYEIWLKEILELI